MSDLMKGYDMLVAITQKEINDQFYRMATGSNPTIETMIKANDLSEDIMMPDSYDLSSYVRGGINPPTVQFHNPDDPDSHDQVLFQFEYATQPIAADNELGLDLSTFTPLSNGEISQNGTDYTYGYILNTEDIHYRDNGGNPQTLANQPVYYFLRTTTTMVGSIETLNYELIPAIYCVVSANPYLIDLTGCQISFVVDLSQIPTSTNSVNDLVANGYLSPDVAVAITSNSFNSNEFSLSQLFLDFDTVDFTQWSVSQPQSTQPVDDATVNMMNINGHTYGATPLNSLMQNTDFTLAFTSNLENAFGVGPQDNVGATPYIININAAAIKPSENEIVLQPSLIPSYICFGTTYNAGNSDLSTIDYQIMGGDDGAANAPVNTDTSIPYITDNVVNSTNYSGTMVYDESALYTPFLLNPIKHALFPGGSWSKSGNQYTASQNTTDYPLGADGEKTTFMGTGYLQKVTETNNNNFSVKVSSNSIFISGTLKQVSIIEITPMLLGWNMGNIDFKWTQTYTVNFSQEVTWSINNNNELIFSVSNPETTTTGPDLTENFLGDITDDISALFGVLSAGYFDPVQGMLDDQNSDITSSVSSEIANIGDNLSSGFSNNFISPTGQVFLLANPLLDSEFNMRMDVTYDV